MERVKNESWRDKAKCHGTNPELFFSVAKEDITAAKNFCADCPVKEACLDFAMTSHQEHGVWGGMSEKDRRNISRNRRHIGGVATKSQYRTKSAL